MPRCKSHNRRVCKPCGTGYCPHDKKPYLCFTCGGSGLCIHGVDKYGCRKCPFASCRHGHLKTRCATCRGSSMCSHGKRRRRCVLCNGRGMCVHQRQLYRCPTCNPNIACPHGHVQSCKRCGRGYCKHGVKKYTKECVECAAARAMAVLIAAITNALPPATDVSGFY